MSLAMVNSVTLRPRDLREFEKAVGTLAETAAEKDETWQWTAHETLFGDTRVIHFAYQAPDFATLEGLGTVAELWQRVLGPKRGEEVFQQANACMEAVEHSVSLERPDLGYPPDGGAAGEYPFAVVTRARARPGEAEACEELIRKIAEAIPKVGDPVRMIAYQVMIGDLLAYWTLRPLRTLAELDQQSPAPDLLNKAFGSGEGGLIWRKGQEAIEQADRQIVMYREDLSNPPQL